MSRITSVSDTDWLRVIMRVDAITKGNSQHSILEDVEWLQQMLALCYAQSAVCRRTNDREYRIYLRVIRGEITAAFNHMVWTLYSLTPTDDE